MFAALLFSPLLPFFSPVHHSLCHHHHFHFLHSLFPCPNLPHLFYYFTFSLFYLLFLSHVCLPCANLLCLLCLHSSLALSLSFFPPTTLPFPSSAFLSLSPISPWFLTHAQTHTQASSASIIRAVPRLPSSPWTASRLGWRGWRFSWRGQRMPIAHINPPPSPLPPLHPGGGPPRCAQGTTGKSPPPLPKSAAKERSLFAEMYRRIRVNPFLFGCQCRTEHSRSLYSKPLLVIMGRRWELYSDGLWFEIIVN